MRYSLNNTLLVFFMVIGIDSAHYFKNADKEGFHKIIDVLINDTL
jgi:hypothetical protein